MFVCAHPVAFCLLSFEALEQPRPMLVHLASTLLYGAPGCTVCEGGLRQYNSVDALEYLRAARRLLNPDGAGRRNLVALAEGAVVAAQLEQQLGIRLQSCPPLALYLDGTSYATSVSEDVLVRDKRRTILVTRARIFSHPAGILLRSLLSEMAIANNPIADAARGHFWFASALGADGSGGDGAITDAWKGWEEMAECMAAFFVPSDIHQRTFIELYRMNVPTFMPAPEWLLRFPILVPYGTFSHEGALPSAESRGRGDFSTSAKGEDHVESSFVPSVSFDARDVSPRVLFYWYQYSDYAHFPHVEHCASIPELLRRLVIADLANMARGMRRHYELLSRGAIATFANAVADVLHDETVL
eukprot:TRINITY_DN65545_c0_g1_i1.p1 TRINITY_DN65545_c0_g1~~TRINITY_DN65545_c0_g1_i1.p1  ORF type:complete len:370 (+),score=27.46 TRINITY_DN65545_c0_g1_i1:38-1111(+)